LEFALSDGATGIAKAVANRAAARRDDPAAPALEHGLDVFHTAREAQRVLATQWRRAEAAWERAEAADATVAEAKRRGIDARTRGLAATARSEWGRARAALERAEHLEAAWGRAAGALEMFDAAGRLNDRARARAEIGAAVKELTGPEWSKVRNHLIDRRSTAYLVRLHRRLEAAEPRAEWREAMAWRWWLRHARTAPAADERIELLCRLARDRDLDEEERASYERVAAVLVDTHRASSAVECMNSVLRMQQSRHRRMTQSMLDLKRLYWNCRAFRSGPRKDRCPYGVLGLAVPTYDFWELLHADPARLAQQLSTQGDSG
jgi:hypothetical protein